MLYNFHGQSLVLWKANAPCCVLNNLKNSQLVETVKRGMFIGNVLGKNLAYQIFIYKNHCDGISNLSHQSHCPGSAAGLVTNLRRAPATDHTRFSPTE